MKQLQSVLILVMVTGLLPAAGAAAGDVTPGFSAHAAAGPADCFEGTAPGEAPGVNDAGPRAESPDAPTTRRIAAIRAENARAAAAAAAGPAPQTVLAPAARQPQGALSGRIVYCSAGHGWTADQDNPGTRTGLWFTQRGDNNEIVEDLGNLDQLTMFANYAFNAGATVVPFRPLGYQSNEVVIDNDDPGAVFTPGASWLDSTNPQYFGDAADTVHYRYTPKSQVETATARYTPDLPAPGFYPVYCWTRDGTDRVSDQLYRISHTGGITEVRINHRMVGKGWIWLGTYYFEAGTGGWVEISNQSNDTNAQALYVIADAVRFGNGMGDVDRGNGVSGKPREEEASRYWIERGLGQGASSTIYDSSDTDQNDNVSAPPRMAAWMNAESEGAMTDRIFLSFHTNLSPGALGLYNGNNDPATRTPNQFRWAELVGREMNDDLVAIGSPPLETPFTDQGPNPQDVTLDRTDIEFGEINNRRINDEFDATILEAGGHGAAGLILADSINLRNPNVRNWIARASLQAMVRYFFEFGGGLQAFLPEPPTNLRAVADGAGGVRLTWEAPIADGIGGDAAQGYVVYRSPNGYGFGQPQFINSRTDTTYTVTGLAPGESWYFRVAATNAGGESLPSDPVGVRLPAAGRTPVLVVNGFDRFGRTQNPRETSPRGIGGPSATTPQTYDRVIPRRSNSFDYIVQHGEALQTVGVAFDSCQNEAVIAGQVALSNYRIVVWILGEESTDDKTFDPAERAAVQAFLAAGGHLFVTGAEIGWELENQSVAPGFYQDVLRGDFLADDGGSYQATGAAGSILDGIVMNFAPGPDIYDADTPDRIAPINGSLLCASYTAGGSGGAGVQYDGGAGGGRVVMLGFPFETIGDASVRADVMRAVIEFFYPDAVSAWWIR
ncbi:MAG: hypothetical protein Kow0059_20120 [Candidatus Sumerlaeia bacterium]